jgi:hypothetical protein
MIGVCYAFMGFVVVAHSSKGTHPTPKQVHTI